MSDHERERIAELRAYRILDTPSETGFDRITRLAGRIFDAPIALISLVGEQRQWFKSRVGLDTEETPRDVAFCDVAIRGRDVMVVLDSHQDARFRDNPLVTGAPGIRFYAGAPIRTARGFALGTVCIIDTKPRTSFTVDGSAALTALAELVLAELEMRRILLTAGERAETLRRLTLAFLTVDAALSLEDLPALAATEACTVLGAAHATVRLDLRQRGARLLEAHRPESADAPAVGEGLSCPINIRDEAAGSMQLAARADGQAYGDEDQAVLLQLARALANAAQQHLLLREARTIAEQLRKSQRLEAVGQLTGGVAHDFNNLLTVILGNADLLAGALQGHPELAALAQMIGGAAQRGAELTQRLLAFAGRQALEPQSVDVSRLVAGMDGLLRRSLGEHIEIRVARGADLWPATVDPAQLESALLNLCINARDAMPDGGRLTIATANTHVDQDDADQRDGLMPGPYVRLTVSDTGSGIAPEHLARVFEPFYTTKETGRGSGLGLSMVYGFIKQSRGHVSIDSEPGQGSTVRIYLPRAASAARADEMPAPVAPVGGHERILLVEDDELVRRYASGQLTALGYQVIEAANGATALEVLRTRADIDLLFTDVVMPGGISGPQLAAAAAALHPGLRILYTSGYTEGAFVDHTRLDPALHLLQKPYRRAELARHIRDALTL